MKKNFNQLQDLIITVSMIAAQWKTVLTKTPHDDLWQEITLFQPKNSMKVAA